MDARHLTMFESILLLGLQQDSGKPSTPSLNFGLAGGVLADLELLERIRVVSEGRKSFVEVTDASTTGMGLLDEALDKIQDAKRRRQVPDWVGRFSTTKSLRQRCADRLLAAGILHHQEHKVAFFTLNRFPESNPGPEAELRFWISQAIAGAPCTKRVATLVGIAYASAAIKPQGTRHEKKEIRNRISHLTAGDPFGAAVQKSLEAHMAATAAAV